MSGIRSMVEWFLHLLLLLLLLLLVAAAALLGRGGRMVVGRTLLLFLLLLFLLLLLLLLLLLGQGQSRSAKPRAQTAVEQGSRGSRSAAVEQPLSSR